jgi:DNA-binding transcriptional LysR family regulator
MAKKYPPLPNLLDIDLRLLRVFLAVVRNRGFSAAQEELNINQPTISVQMSQLEARLRVCLCHRGRGGFKLTSEGEFVYEATLKLFEAIEQYRNDIVSSRGELAGELHIGIVDAVATNMKLGLHRTIREFNKIAPSVNLQIHVRSPHALLRSLLEERIHLAIAPFSSVPQSISLIELHKEIQILYCARTHKLFDMDDKDITKDLLAKTPYAARSYLHDWSQSDSPQFLTCASTGDMEAMALYVLSGQFIGHLPRHYAEQWTNKGEIRPILKDKLSYSSQFYLAHRNEEKNVVVLEFLQQLEKLQDFN